MIKKSTSKGIIKDLAIVGIGILAILLGLYVIFGIVPPVYVVASGSMVPALNVHDVIVVTGHAPFEDVKVGDIIVFQRPPDHDRVIVHRVASILDDDPKKVRTKGDANPASLPVTDYPTEKEYIGTVIFTIPQIGFLKQIPILSPPNNYVIIAIIIGIMVAIQFRKKDRKDSLLRTDDLAEEMSDIKTDSEYAENNSNVLDNADTLELPKDPAEEMDDTKPSLEYAEDTSNVLDNADTPELPKDPAEEMDDTKADSDTLETTETQEPKNDPAEEFDTDDTKADSDISDNADTPELPKDPVEDKKE